MSEEVLYFSRGDEVGALPRSALDDLDFETLEVLYLMTRAARDGEEEIVAGIQSNGPGRPDPRQTHRRLQRGVDAIVATLAQRRRVANDV